MPHPPPKKRSPSQHPAATSETIKAPIGHKAARKARKLCVLAQLLDFVESHRASKLAHAQKIWREQS